MLHLLYQQLFVWLSVSDEATALDCVLEAFDEAVELALADDVELAFAELLFADDFNATVFDDLAAEVVATEATWLSELFDT